MSERKSQHETEVAKAFLPYCDIYPNETASGMRKM